MKRRQKSRLHEALSATKATDVVKDLTRAVRAIIWELIKSQKAIKKLEGKLDKKMHQVTKRMETAKKDVKKGKKKAAVKVLEKAEKKNEKLVKIDKEVRDPIIKKYKKLVKKEKK